MIRRFFGSLAKESVQEPDLNILDYNPAVWLDAQDASTIVLADGKVSQWSDKATGNHAIQTNPSMRPLYSANAVSNQLPSIETLDGNGVGFDLSFPSSFWEAFFVTAYKTGIETTFSNFHTLLIPTTASNFDRLMGASGAATLFSGSGALTNQVFKNGSEVGSNIILPLPLTVCNFRFSSGVNLFNLLKSSVTASRNWPGFTGEIILFQTQLSIEDRLDIANHLKNKWRI